MPRSITPRARRARFGIAAAVTVAFAVPLQAQMMDRPDLDAIYKIKQEGFQNSQVMDITSWLTDVYGPRLTGSPNIRTAGEWALQQLTGWGLVNAELEPWGQFGRGWSNERFVVHAVSPQKYPIIGYPSAWTPGTNGPVTAEVALATIATEEDMATYRGTLRGKFVLTQPMREVEAQFDALGRRLTEDELAALAMQPPPRAGGPRFRGGNRGFRQRLMEFYTEEGVAALIHPGRGDGGTIFGTGNGPRDPEAPETPPQLSIAIEHYGRIVRTLEKNIPVTLEIDIQNQFYDDDLDGFNVIAEIPGTDKADEVVMLGGHFDSWHGGTGATDNAAGSAIMMEAVRILQATGLRPRRTVRIALWSGEEQGLLGSRAYVRNHFADPATGEQSSAYDKFSAYFNVDNGTGAIRGVYLQGNEAVAPIFQRWMTPFNNLGMSTLTIRNTGGTDHLAFDAVGLPGFQFIQDPVEYSTRTHHSNMDVYERIQAVDMMNNAVIVASFVYHTAMREERLPREPMPVRPRTDAGAGR